MSIAENLRNLLKTIPDNVKLVAVSKTQPVENILCAYKTGQRIFGENKVQELIEKQPRLPADIVWHMLGHLQTNKVKYIAPFISIIHSVDSLKLLKEIDKEGAKNNRIIDCLFEFYIAREESKFGLSMEEAFGILNSEDYKRMKNIRICGVMGIASFVDDLRITRIEFKTLLRIFSELKSEFFSDKDYFLEISMGMSSDYLIAIEEGATMVRIGTAVFGERDYSK
jgi:PLP dependent protein